MGRTLWIIADDYGLGEQHDSVIRALLRDSAIHGTSVLSETCSLSSAQTLSSLWTSDRRVGLHLNLTWSTLRDERRPSRNILLSRSLLGLAGGGVARSLASQWHRFEELFGRTPDYIDGHEHCHAFPTIRQIVLEFAARHGVAVRSMVPMVTPSSIKELVIAKLGKAVYRQAETRGVSTNEWFGGVLPIDRPDQAICALAREIAMGQRMAADGKVVGEIWIMVHPGSPLDPIQIPGHSPLLRGSEASLLRKIAVPDAATIQS